MSNLADLPLVLRPEHFGGVLFDPADGTFLELDREGFALLWDYADDPQRPVAAPAADFLEQVRGAITRLEGRAFRRIPAPQPEAGAPLPVLSGPSLVDFQITHRCHLDCPHCYASSTPEGTHAELEDIHLALDQIAEVGAYQVALGGGEPLLHPELGSVLARCHELGIVPNLTTSGFALSESRLDLLRRYCGAVGLSLEGVGEHYDRYRASGFRHFARTLERLKEAGVPVVLQVTLNTDTFSRLAAITDFCCRQQDVYGVIFLAFKPVGRGAASGRPLAGLDPARVNARLQEAFFALAQVTRVGFDCCLTPAVTGTGSTFDSHAAGYLEGCSALRSSLGLLPNLDVAPCTFTPDHVVGNLHREHLGDIWRGLATATFRDRMAARAAANGACASCAKYGYCLGGCPVMDLVNCTHDYLGAG